MAVNTMSFEDASTILNSIRTQVTGLEPVAIENSSDFVSVATTLLQAGYDPVLESITQLISRTIFSIRPYNRKFGGLQADAIRWGSITRKLSISDKDWEKDVRFELVDGEPVEMFAVNKPNILQTNFYGQNVFSKSYTIFRDQLDNAFRSVDEFSRFMSLITTNMSDMIEQAHEGIARMTIGNFIGGKVAAQNSVIHLLTEYNAATGAGVTSQTVYSPENFGNFVKWMYARIASITALMTERSVKYQINVTGKEISRHTPYEYQKVYIYNPILQEINARVLADTFHDTFLRFADVEAVNYWQSIDSPNALKVIPSYTDTTGAIVTAEEQELDNIIGVIFDRDAIGYTTIHNWSSTTPFNSRGGYWNVFHHFTEKWWNDFTEKGIILMLD